MDGLFKLMGRTPSIGLLSDEAGAFLGGYAMKASHAQRTYACFNNLWDGRQIRLARKAEETILRGRRISTHLMMQPSVATSLLNDPLAESIGFLPRCLIVEPKSTIGTRKYQAINEEDRKPIEAFQMRFGALLDLPLPVPDPETHELAPRNLCLSDDAKVYLIRIANGLEAEQAPGRQFEKVTAFASKTCEQACRIAGVITLWRDANAQEVEKEDMQNGLVLALYYLKEAKRLADASAADPLLQAAETLRQWLIARQEPRFLTADVQQNAPRAVRCNAAKLLPILEKHHWIQRLPDGTVIDGVRRKSAWMLRA